MNKPGLKHNPDVIETDLGDELVLLSSENRKIYTLNNSGRLIWQHLPEAGIEATIQKLTETFAVEEDEAKADVQELLQLLVEAGLLVSEPHAPL